MCSLASADRPVHIKIALYGRPCVCSTRYNGVALILTNFDITVCNFGPPKCALFNCMCSLIA